MMESKCKNCYYFSELKPTRRLNDGSVIQGYCYKDIANDGEGKAVYLPDGCCTAFKAKVMTHDITHYVCWACRYRNKWREPYFAIEGRNAYDQVITRDFITYRYGYSLYAGMHAAEYACAHNAIPQFHLKQKECPGYSKPALKDGEAEVKVFDPEDIVNKLRINASTDLVRWFKVAYVGDHYDGGDFTIDVEEYAKPGWEVRKREDEQDEKPKDIAL